MKQVRRPRMAVRRACLVVFPWRARSRAHLAAAPRPPPDRRRRAALGAYAAGPQALLRRDRGQPLVEQPHGRGRQPGRELGGELAGEPGRLSFAPRQRGGQPHHDLDRLVLRDDRRDAGEVALASSDSLHRRGQHPRRVTAGHADTYGADVHADPCTEPHVSRAAQKSPLRPGAARRRSPPVACRRLARHRPCRHRHPQEPWRRRRPAVRP